LVANGKFTTVEIAAELKMSPNTLKQWKKRRDFEVRVERHRQIWRDRVMLTGIADQARRIEALNDRWSRMKTVIEARAADPTMKDVPGGTTGLLVAETKQVPGTGEIVDEFSVDTALLRELRAHEEQAAKELGQWTDKHDVNIRDFTWVELAREIAAEGIDVDAPLEQPPQAGS
jgi:hypothetical protein